MRVVDMHAHLAPRAALERAGWLVRQDGTARVRIGDRWQEISPALVDAEILLADADASRIASRVVSLPPFLLRHDLAVADAVGYCRAMNDGLAADAGSSGGRLQVLAAVPLQDPAAAVRELSRAVQDLGCVGAVIATNVAGTVELDDPLLAPFWGAAAALRALVFIHPHDVAGVARMKEYHLRNLVGNPLETTLAASRLIFGGVLDRHPDLQVLLAHGGGTLPWLTGRLDRGFIVRPECRTTSAPPSHWAACFFYDTVLFNARAVRALVELVGPQRVVLGSDFPFDMGDPDAVGTVERALEDPQARQQVLSANADRFRAGCVQHSPGADTGRHPQERGGTQS